MRTLLAIILTTAPGFTACASIGGLEQEPLDQGELRAYKAPVEEVAVAIGDAMVALGFRIDAEETDTRSWIIVADKGVSLFSYGEIVRAVVKDGGNGYTEVRIITKKRMATNVFAKGDWSSSVFDRVEQELGGTATASASRDSATEAKEDGN